MKVFSRPRRLLLPRTEDLEVRLDGPLEYTKRLGGLAGHPQSDPLYRVRTGDPVT